MNVLHDVVGIATGALDFENVTLGDGLVLPQKLTKNL